ncbi:MAG: hypothetical protein EOP34_06390 [Rickettsiales bacterium]|nr:MAG: hypothetical protein EOP34_06390 [Rickettsiales bacterium]
MKFVRSAVHSDFSMQQTRNILLSLSKIGILFEENDFVTRNFCYGDIIYIYSDNKIKSMILDDRKKLDNPSEDVTEKEIKESKDQKQLEFISELKESAIKHVQYREFIVNYVNMLSTCRDVRSDFRKKEINEMIIDLVTRYFSESSDQTQEITKEKINKKFQNIISQRSESAQSIAR